MDKNVELLHDVAVAYYILSSNVELYVAEKIWKSKQEDNAKYFQRFIDQCKTNDVNPIWVLKTIFAIQPATKRAVKIFPSNLSSDYAWKRWYLNYDQMKRQMEYKNNLNPASNKLDKKDVIMGQVRHATATFKSFLTSYSVKFTKEELLRQFAATLSPYFLASCKEAVHMYKRGEFSQMVRTKIENAYEELSDLKLLAFTKDIVSTGGAVA